ALVHLALTIELLGANRVQATWGLLAIAASFAIGINTISFRLAGKEPGSNRIFHLPTPSGASTRLRAFYRGWSCALVRLLFLLAAGDERKGQDQGGGCDVTR